MVGSDPSEAARIAPGPPEGIVDHLEQVVQDPQRESPHDVAIRSTDDDSGKAHVGQLRNHVLYVPALVVEVGERKPEGGLDLARVEPKRRIARQVEGVRRHEEPRADAGIARAVVEASEILRVGQVEAHLPVKLKNFTIEFSARRCG